MKPKESQFEASYQQDKNYWGSAPSTVIRDQLSLLIPGSVLDVGAGDGRNAIYLAEQGFAVTAMDTAPTGLANIMEKARAQGVEGHVTTIEGDVRRLKLARGYANIITNFTLHFLGSIWITPVLEKFVEATSPGGINLIDDFTRNGPLAAKRPQDYITPDMLSQFYESRGWRVLYTKLRNVQTKAFESPGVPYNHETVAFIAQKPNE